MKSAQAKRFKQFKSRFGDYRGADLKPTPEQIALKKKRAEEEARLQAKLKAKRHRGGFGKTKKGKQSQKNSGK